jgi:hypothetical protein
MRGSGCGGHTELPVTCGVDVEAEAIHNLNSCDDAQSLLGRWSYFDRKSSCYSSDCSFDRGGTYAVTKDRVAGNLDDRAALIF